MLGEQEKAQLKDINGEVPAHGLLCPVVVVMPQEEDADGQQDGDDGDDSYFDDEGGDGVWFCFSVQLPVVASQEEHDTVMVHQEKGTLLEVTVCKKADSQCHGTGPLHANLVVSCQDRCRLPAPKRAVIHAVESIIEYVVCDSDAQGHCREESMVEDVMRRDSYNARGPPDGYVLWDVCDDDGDAKEAV